MGKRELAALTAVIVAASLMGCGGSGSPPSGAGVGASIDVPLRLADCTDWKQADAAERLGTVRQLRDFTAGPAGAPRGAVLNDEQAYRLFQNFCGNYFARGFKLYKLYGRAAAFAGLGQ